MESRNSLKVIAFCHLKAIICVLLILNVFVRGKKSVICNFKQNPRMDSLTFCVPISIIYSFFRKKKEKKRVIRNFKNNPRMDSFTLYVSYHI